MDFNDLITSSKWDILELLSKKPASPTELAEKIKTTVSYVSQQLKILEAAGIVFKKKTKNSNKGQPRSLFSISKEFFYLFIVSNGYSNKRLLNLNEQQKIILKIWLYEDSNLHYPLEKIFRFLEDKLTSLAGFFIIKGKKTRVLILSDSKFIKSRLLPLSKEFADVLDLSVCSVEESSKFELESSYVLYDSNSINDLKGGVKKNEF